MVIYNGKSCFTRAEHFFVYTYWLRNAAVQNTCRNEYMASQRRGMMKFTVFRFEESFLKITLVTERVIFTPHLI